MLISYRYADIIDRVNERLNRAPLISFIQNNFTKGPAFTVVVHDDNKIELGYKGLVFTLTRDDAGTMYLKVPNENHKYTVENYNAIVSQIKKFIRSLGLQ